MPSSPWSSEATYNFSDQTPLLNSGKTQEQIDQENLDRETKAAIQKSRQIKKGKEKEKAAGRTQRNRQTWNPAKVAQEAIARPLSGVSAKLDEVLAPVNKVVADSGEQFDKNLLGIKDTEELAKRRRLRSGDKGERAKSAKEFKDKLSAKAIVIIDDVNRDGERKLAEDFAKALPNHTLTILDHEKGTAIIAPR